MEHYRIIFISRLEEVGIVGSKTGIYWAMDAENGLNYKNSNWAYHVKCLLEECGLSFIWQNQFNNEVNFNIIKQRILDIYCQQWYSEINNSRRLESYCLFKQSFKFENYLDFIT